MKTITDDQRQLIHAVIAEGLTNLPAGVLEKDLLITTVLGSLAALSSLDFAIVFCGGTCLAKAHGLIRRMSEDLDFKVLVPPGLSRSAQSRKLSKMKQTLVRHFSDMGLHIAPGGVTAHDQNNYFLFKLQFQSAFSEVVSLRSEIQVEFTVRPVLLATQQLPIRSMLEILAYRPTKAFELTCIGVEETLAEKTLSLLRRTAELLAGRNRDDFDPRLVRHLYDIHEIVSHHPHLPAALHPGLFASLVTADALQFSNQHPEFAKDSAAELTHALAAIKNERMFGDHYRRFLNDLVFGESVAFDDALATFDAVATKLLAQLPESA